MRGGISNPDEALAQARDGLALALPEASARRRLTRPQLGLIAFLAITLPLLGWVAPGFLTASFTACAVALFALAIAFRAFGAISAACRIRPARPESDPTAAAPFYTLLCALHREAEALPGLIEALRRLDHPADRREIVLALEADDLETVAAAAALSDVTLVLTPPGAPRTKPKALMYALPQTRGEFVVVYDAEDRPEPQQLRAALNAFAVGGPKLACVQAPLLIDNARESWISGQFALEYAILFRQILPLLSRIGAPVILGGTSNHFRRSALLSCGGWDPFNVTEDADIGYRLARQGWKLGLIDPPTWEEAPISLPAWIRQRSRWIKGHLQTWLVLMRAPLRLHRELGVRGFWTMQLLLFGGILASFAHAPWLALLVWSAIDGPPWALALSAAGYGASLAAAFVAAAQQRSWRLALAALTTPLYWPLAFPAALIALYELVVRPFTWAKTEHGLSARATPTVTCPPPPRFRSWGYVLRSALLARGGFRSRPIP